MFVQSTLMDFLWSSIRECLTFQVHTWGSRRVCTCAWICWCTQSARITGPQINQTTNFRVNNKQMAHDLPHHSIKCNKHQHFKVRKFLARPPSEEERSVHANVRNERAHLLQDVPQNTFPVFDDMKLKPTKTTFIQSLGNDMHEWHGSLESNSRKKGSSW